MLKHTVLRRDVSGRIVKTQIVASEDLFCEVGHNGEGARDVAALASPSRLLQIGVNLGTASGSTAAGL